MRTDKELAEAVVNDPFIAERFKVDERKKLEVCSRCPESKKCWSCGFREWWK